MLVSSSPRQRQLSMTNSSVVMPPNEGMRMIASQSFPTYTANRIDGHLCTRCKAPMVLAWVWPASMGFALCTFDCEKCERTERVTLQTASKRRHSSPLRAPN